MNIWPEGSIIMVDESNIEGHDTFRIPHHLLGTLVIQVNICMDLTEMLLQKLWYPENISLKIKVVYESLPPPINAL